MYFSEMKSKLYFISLIFLFNFQQGFSQIKIDNYPPDIDYLGLNRIDYDEVVISTFEFDLLEKISEVRLKIKHAAHWKYILSSDRLGYSNENISNKKLEEFLKNIIFDPLKMNHNHYELLQEKVKQLDPFHSEKGRVPIELNNPKKHTISWPGFQSDYHFNTINKADSGDRLVSTILDNPDFLNINQNVNSLVGNITLMPKSVELKQLNYIEDIPFIKKNYLFGIEFRVIKELKKRDNIVNIAYLCWGGIFYTRFWVNTTYKLIGLTIAVEFPFSLFNSIKKFKPRNYQSLY